MNETDLQITNALLQFIQKCPTAYHTTESLADELGKSGFRRFSFADAACIKPGTKGFFTRNNSSLIAFSVPEQPFPGFMVAAAHTDSPMFKVKPNGTLTSLGYALLDVERYGGSITSTWLDKPLGLAGRVVLRQGNRLYTKLIDSAEPVALIPNTCPHQNKAVNNGFTYNPATDLRPIFGTAGCDFMKIAAGLSDCAPEEIIGSDLFLYNRTPGCVWGADSDFFSAPRIDNLQSVYAILQALTDKNSRTNGAISIMACFDNEETGSSSKQGAASDFLHSVLSFLSEQLRFSYYTALPASFILSVDNAQGIHPNHPELYDTANAVKLNGGIVLKTSAAGSYATDAVSGGFVRMLCEKSCVPCQFFANRSDIPGGTTLGPIADTRVSVNTADIGLAQLAMHSSYETAGVADTAYMVRACRTFFNTVIHPLADGAFELEFERSEQQ